MTTTAATDATWHAGTVRKTGRKQPPATLHLDAVGAPSGVGFSPCSRVLTLTGETITDLDDPRLCGACVTKARRVNAARAASGAR